MLQIASGMYYDSTDLHETVHRRVVYSNAMRMSADDIELPIGTLRFASGFGAVQPLTIEAIDRLEKVNADGSDSIHIATGGDELIEDVSDVVAFGLDVVVQTDPDLAERVVTGISRSGRRPVKLLRRTLDSDRYVTDEELDHLRGFCEKLISLERPYFEAAMRAIRRLADATTLTASDVTLAYTIYVAALESLSKDAVAPSMPWAEYDKPKRLLIEGATADLPVETADKIHTAVLQVDQLALRRRYQGFVLDHLSPEYYRSEAVGATQPARAVDLPKALDFAYRVRSVSLHELRDLAPELWVVAGLSETIWHDGRMVLTIEGLHRLCQHVIRAYVDRSPQGIDATFKAAYREAIPGILRLRPGAQLWISGQSQFPAKDGPRFFTGLVEMLDAAMRGEAETVAAMALPLERIEQLLPGEAHASKRLPLIATYRLWHTFLAKEHHRPDADRVLETYGDLLDNPSLYSLTVDLMSGTTHAWKDHDLERLVDDREESLRRSTKSTLELPRRIDAAFQIEAARRAWNRGDQDAAIARISSAIELVPGEQALIDVESEMRGGRFDLTNLRGFITTDRDGETA